MRRRGAPRALGEPCLLEGGERGDLRTNPDGEVHRDEKLLIDGRVRERHRTSRDLEVREPTLTQHRRERVTLREAERSRRAGSGWRKPEDFADCTPEGRREFILRWIVPH